MKLEENTMLRAPRQVSGDGYGAPEDISTWVVRCLPGEGDKFLSMAPGRLDVLGGFADYSGGLVLTMPIGRCVCAGAQLRSDGLLRVVHRSTADGSGNTFELPLDHFRAGDGWIEGAAAARLMQPWSPSVRGCAATVIEALRRRLIAGPAGGFSLAVASDLEDFPAAGYFGALGAAVVTALCAACQVNLDPLDAVSICMAMENQWLDSPAGPADALSALLGESSAISQLRCENHTLGARFRLPCGLRLTAIDCGSRCPDHHEKFKVVRTTAFMGRLLIDKIVHHENILGPQWDGHLSRISVNDFVERIGDRLPMRISGAEFLERFGETADPLTRIDPRQTYKIRSRTEHHVYEHARSRQFVEALSRGARTSDRSAFVEAGKAMNASHWSYGQRCGLGTVAANGLVNSLRKADPGAGLFGARIAGRGCGGMVAVLSEDSQAAQQAIEESMQAYAHSYNTTARILSGSLDGAMLAPPLRV